MMELKREFFYEEVQDGFYVPSIMKRAWGAGLTILSEIDRICRKYEIPYYAGYGTLLGAVRSSSFIPWDDDIDLMMLRSDYNRFLSVAEKELPEEEGKDTLILTLREGEPELCKRLKILLDKLFGEEFSLQCISHTEAFAHYLLRQDKTLYNRLVGMFEFSNQVLHYYEMQVSKGAKKYTISAGEAQPEAISFDIMEKPQGKRMADQILSGLSDKITRGKVYSAFFLSGKGFESTDFAPGFMKKLLKGRRVCVESFLFAIGALEYAKLLGRGEEEEYLLLCESRVAYDISVRVSQKEREFPYYLAKAGDAWLEKEEEILLLMDQQDYIDFTVQPFVGSKGRQLRMLLEGFPKREERCTKLSLKSQFVDASTILIRVEDRGLGDLHPASGMVIEERISLGKE